jgi:hypothetical protein
MHSKQVDTSIFDISDAYRQLSGNSIPSHYTGIIQNPGC